MKRNRDLGITLVALVVTIVVLLILAGVSINLVLGENGLITQAKEAKSKTEIELVKEKKQLAMLNASANISNYVYTDKKGNTAIIPAGFAISEIEGENIIEDGLVIIDTNGNEFVYVPIDDINLMAQCELADGTCHLALDENQNLVCDKHNSSTIVGKLYASEVGEDFGNENNQYLEESGLREPSTITGWQKKQVDALNYNLANFSSYDDMVIGLKKEYKAMAESVAKNGGFYIARYETSLDNNNVRFVKIWSYTYNS